MASSKISNLPAASSVTSASLIAVVNSGDTYKATISQLPLGISSVNNLGGGTTLGAISGSELQLKTLIAGTGLSFTTTTNTITLATTLGITSVGSGTSLINSFSNPNLALKSITGSGIITVTNNTTSIDINGAATTISITNSGSGTSLINSFSNPNAVLKSITGSNGITVTDNTTSINISNTVNPSTYLVDSIIGSIEAPTVKEYVLESYINRAYTINNLYLITASGSATVRLVSKNSGNTIVTTGSTFTANTTRSTNTISSFTTSVGQQLVFEVVTNTAALDLSFTVDLIYS